VGEERLPIIGGFGSLFAVRVGRYYGYSYGLVKGWGRGRRCRGSFSKGSELRPISIALQPALHPAAAPGKLLPHYQALLMLRTFAPLVK